MFTVTETPHQKASAKTVDVSLPFPPSGSLLSPSPTSRPGFAPQEILGQGADVALVALTEAGYLLHCLPVTGCLFVCSRSSSWNLRANHSSCTKLTLSQWFWCLLAGFGELLWGQVSTDTAFPRLHSRQTSPPLDEMEQAALGPPAPDLCVLLPVPSATRLSGSFHPEGFQARMIGAGLQRLLVSSLIMPGDRQIP